MYITKSTTKILTTPITNPNKNPIKTISNLITKTLQQYSQNKQSEIYNEFINNQNNIITFSHHPNFKFKLATVPRNNPSTQSLQQQLEKQCKNCKIALNIDPSHLIGIKRLMAKNHLQQNIYKGISQPQNFYTKINPSAQISTTQLKFDDTQFIFNDPIAKQILNKKQFKTQQQQNQILIETISNLYQKQPKRFSTRLQKQLNVPQPYQKIIQFAMYNHNPIYFCGFNQYPFRNYLTNIINLNQLRHIFMLSLKFAQQQTYQFIANPINSQNQQNLQNRYHIYAKQLIYLNYYQYIQKIQNGQIIKKLNFIANEKNTNSTQEPQTNKGRKKKITTQTNKQNLILFAHSYTIQTLHQYTKIKNIENYTLQTNTKITSQSQQIPFPPKKQSKQTQNDSQKIQKNAILEVMLGNLWNKSFTFNRFPYLSQDFTKLNNLDKETVKKIYQQNLSKYNLAKKVFYQQNINKFNNMSQQQKNIAKLNFLQATKQYQKNKQQINQNQNQNHKIKQQSKKQNQTSNFSYQENYQENNQDNIISSNNEIKQKQQPKSKITKQMKNMMKQFQLQESQVETITPKSRIKRGRSRINKNTKTAPQQNKQDNQV